ncbi:MAG: ACT domain-containing protein [Acidobacteriota bacterium]
MWINLYLPETRFVVVSLSLTLYTEVLESLMGVEGFTSLTRDKDEITLILSEDEWGRISSRFSTAQVLPRRRMIAFDTVLDFTVVGFIAEISRALAEAGISILNTSTYRTDIVFVDDSRFDAAVAAIKRALVTLRYTHLSQH